MNNSSYIAKKGVREMERREELERCETVQVHRDIVEKVNAEMPDEEVLYDLAELFKLFGDS